MADQLTDSATAKKEKPTAKADRVLDALDFEIGRIDSEQTRKGWTLWAVLGAIASGVWLLLDQSLAELHLLTILQLILCLTITFYVWRLVNVKLSPRHLKKNPTTRFRSLGETNRQQLFFELVRCIAIASIALIATAGVSFYHRLIVLTVFGLFAFVSAAAFIFYLLGFLIPDPPRELRIVDSVIWIVILALCWSCYGYLSAVLSSPDGVSVADLRFAGLVTGISFLIPMLATELATPPLLSSLIEIRRDLALGRVDVTDAEHQLDIAILGMNVEDVFQEDVRKILEYFETLNRQIAAQETELDKIQSLPSRIADVSDEELKETEAVLEKVDNDNSNIQIQLIPALQKQVAVLKRRMLFIPKDSESRSAISQILHKIRDAADESLVRISSYRERLKGLKSQLEAASEKS